ncbi:MAG: pyridoxine 5'-phosphate synthase [Bacteroidetes bacterium]|nr:pyridoxine 5'-phosphate synthase [Bacteroidota bacterium]MCB9042623.1 pyridoxine 5'-phosphate synthase [Chitinophagales bacterium]
MATRLSVNINKVALIRNARGGNVPNLLQVAKDCEIFGAEGITVHPRPDQRHVRYEDVIALKPIVQTELNVEGYPSEHFLQLIEKVKPHQCTLVPDPPDALTSSEGWDTFTHQQFLREVIARIKQVGTRVSLFMETDTELIEAAFLTGTDRIELYTGPYAKDFTTDPVEAVAPFAEAAQRAVDLGLEVNAGHDLSLQNLQYFHQQVPQVVEVSIGHALISDALYFGLRATIEKYKDCLD